MRATLGLMALLLATPAMAQATAQDKPLAGTTLTIATVNDQFAAPMATLAPEFERETGATVRVDIMTYGELLTKTTADFVGHTKGYGLVTMDIVWAGQFAENGYSVDLTERMKRDAATLRQDDIYPVLMDALGRYGGKQVAYPFAGYANVLAYRKDLYDKAGLKPPASMEDYIAAANRLNDPQNRLYGFVANGQKGAAGAQDWMQYNAQLGGSLLKDGKPALNSDENIHSLTVYKALFDKAAPPGAVDYDWSGREESFRQGLVANMETWSVGAPGYYNPALSKIVDKVAIVPAPSAKGLPVKYGVGGWGLAINADADAATQEAAWRFIAWVTSPAIHKRLALMGSGSFLRRSEMTDPELNAKFPFLRVLATTFEHGDGDYRPRIPQYGEMQDLIGTAVNGVLAGGLDPKAALDEAQAKAEGLF